ncbi:MULTISPECIES: MurR/RpiR family transcriptional regulator [Curtobacterium]|jgi:DNA-binding MurR/RpiR family transcriptional regulator|uniref:MurR/RpiR family transcriptional regulator n=1 Tax=Curtobacterium TaxID=2034 RepID=UPI000DAAA2A9|nr:MULTISPECIES: SIS domain-containing protein [Curtobacterium]MBB1198376.1 MurR/RpiR family transcriptional regulator [Curtobacterium flaccumfaciens]MBT1666988.1 SIS domain-containing protein [Curtobacterium flaccumfaciens pv. flaccumfaciens]MBT1673994.1 SIS domain-containing protein [Curtobacterium flaccumfaciens pv. flaccumfaciens]MCS0645803.1 SIS domain-containing protein [Curtobacterium flaccumfaciens pv. flaccumfaciens]MCS6525574.1 SIS domain-containing protein [Curtobacterium flaccumfac
MSTAGPDVRARIDSVWEQLSPAERRVAAMVRHDPELLLVGTSAELAAESGTSKATVSRLVRSLGFQDAAEVRQNLMSARGSGLPWVAEDAAHVDQRAVEARNLDAAFASLGRADRPRLARRIVRARRVLVLGERGAYPIALQLRSQLAQVRSDVRVGPSPGQRLGEEVADLDRHDLVVLVTVRRHTAGVERIVRHCVDSGADVIVLGDPTAAVIAAPAATAILCPVDSPSAFDSMAALFAVVAAITNDVYDASGPGGRVRVDAVATAYDALGELAAP